MHYGHVDPTKEGWLMERWKKMKTFLYSGTGKSI